MKSSKIKKSAAKQNPLHGNVMQLYSLIALPALLVFVFNYIPMAGIVIAFKNYKFSQGIFGSKWVGIKNFEIFFKSNDFLKITRNTLSLNFMFIVFGILFALLIAILLFELKSRLSVKIFQTALITPYFLSWVVVSYMAYAFLNPSFGILNNMLTAMGLPLKDWYSTPEVWPWILTISSVWKGFGIDSVIYYAALMSIDSSLFEAADMDGANGLQKVWSIVIPSLVPIITITTILKIGNIFRADFGLFYQLTRDVGSLYDATDVIDTYIFRTMRNVGNMGMSSAVGLLQGVVGMVVVLITNRLSKLIDPDVGLL